MIKKLFPVPPLSVGVHPGQGLDGPLRRQKGDPFVGAPLDIHDGAGILIGQQVDPEDRLAILLHEAGCMGKVTFFELR